MVELICNTAWWVALMFSLAWVVVTFLKTVAVVGALQEKESPEDNEIIKKIVNGIEKDES